MVIQRYDVFLVPLDPAEGHEMRKTRPCAVISPTEVNKYVHTVLIAPLTSVPRKYPFRVTCNFAGRLGQVSLDQIRCVDQSRLLKRVGRLEPSTQTAVAKALVAMFSS